MLKPSFRCAALAVAALALGSAAAAPARADGTVIHIKNDTDQAMTFFVEFQTSAGQIRHFTAGMYLRAGQSTTFTAEPEYTIKKRNGKYMVRVRGFEGKRSTKWASIEDETPDLWWGGNESSVTGLKAETWEDDDGNLHVSARLIR